MTFDPTQPVQTRDGRKARIICTDRVSPHASIVALLKNGDSEGVYYYHTSGQTYGNQEHKSDLINIPEKRWAVIYTIEGEYGVLVTAHEETLSDVKRTAGAIACLEFTEGDGL